MVGNITVGMEEVEITIKAPSEDGSAINVDFTINTPYTEEIKHDFPLLESNSQGIHEDDSQQLDLQVKSEVSDSNSNDDTYSQIQSLVNEELHIKDDHEDCLLDTNIRIHTTEQDFHCSFCTGKFTSKRSFKQHLKIHNKTNLLPTTTCNSLNVNSVSNLLKIDYTELPHETKLKIKELGRPLPELKLKQVVVSRNRTYTRQFSKDIYAKNNWICGCEVLNLFYCFPCLLFFNGTDHNWTKTGVKDLNHLSVKIKKHEATGDHINACTELALLGKANIITHLNSAYRNHIVEHNNTVRKNRNILRRIICCVKFCSAFELAPRGYDESENSINRGTFRDLVDFTAELDLTLKEHLQNATVFKETSKVIQNDILDCMLAVCREEISNQIDNSEFLAIQCDETADVTNCCQMVLTFRYLYEGSIYENFWAFMRIEDKTASGLKECIENEIDPLILQTPQKLIAQTYDGTSGVQVQIKQKYPCAHFIYCYAHQLNLVIQKTASQNSKVRVFFNNLSAIPAFVSNPSHRCDVLQEILNRILPKMAGIKWTYNIRTVNFVYENLDKLIEVFEEIEENCLKSVTSNEASGLRRALTDPEFVFWLRIFHRILPHVDILYSQFLSKNKNSVELQEDILNFERTISSVRVITDNIQNGVEYKFNGTKRKRINTNNYTRSINAKKVCDVIAKQMKDRFSYRGHLQAAELLNHDSFLKYSKTFPQDVFDTVTSSYRMLCKTKLKIELEVIYTKPDLRGMVGAMNILSFMLESGLTETFAETVKLLKIIVTTPMTTTESERCFSTLNRIKTFLQNSMVNDRLNALAMLSINRNWVHEINGFEEKVMEKFISMKNRGLEFNFKK